MSEKIKVLSREEADLGPPYFISHPPVCQICGEEVKVSLSFEYTRWKYRCDCGFYINFEMPS